MRYPTQPFLPLLLLLSILPSTLALPASKTLPLRLNVTALRDDITDPYYQGPLPNSAISLLCSGFIKPSLIQFDRVLLESLVQRAQTEIVKAVIDAKGDAPIPQPNLEWESIPRRVVLRVNHRATDKPL
ncbi:MAG: hypothetical protein Q9186_007600, partial [Xanthomendoza sp. 1 TL-2023]